MNTKFDVEALMKTIEQLRNGGCDDVEITNYMFSYVVATTFIPSKEFLALKDKK